MAAILFAAMILPVSAQENSLPRRTGAVNETYSGHDVIYDSVRNAAGQNLRVIVTRPSTSGKFPTIFLAGWLSCDTVEAPATATDSISLIFRRLAALPDFVLVRLEKPGVGDSEGDCSKTDFNTELESYRAAFRHIQSYDFVDANKLFILGSSNGAGWAPLVSEGTLVRGYVVFGAWVKTWFEHMMEIERRRLTLSGKSPGEVNALMPLIARFYTKYLVEGRTPRTIIEQEPTFQGIWPEGKDVDHLYGRPVAYYQQLQKLNLADTWSHVSVPLLVMHGQYDWIMTREDSEIIVALVNKNAARAARFIDVPNAGHSLDHHDSLQSAFGSKALPFEPKVADQIADWYEKHH
jgi:pimeloyl-ACP methyl ester carboxylesterase